MTLTLSALIATARLLQASLDGAQTKIGAASWTAHILTILALPGKLESAGGNSDSQTLLQNAALGDGQLPDAAEAALPLEQPAIPPEAAPLLEQSAQPPARVSREEHHAPRVLALTKNWRP